MASRQWRGLHANELSSGQTVLQQQPRYRLRLWRHSEPVFVMTGGPNYDIRTPDMSAAHGLCSLSGR